MDVSSVRLMTNNPSKVKGIEETGIKVSQRVSIESNPTEHNKEYLDVKANKMGHLFKK